MTILSKKQQSLHPYGKVTTLQRIAVRATKKADWIEWEAPHAPDHSLTASDREVIAKHRARALAATIELAHVVVDNPDLDWTLPQRRAAERAVAASEGQYVR